jgi:hypothetical protein
MYKIKNNTNQTFQFINGKTLKPYGIIYVETINDQIKSLQKKGIVLVTSR